MKILHGFRDGVFLTHHPDTGNEIVTGHPAPVTSGHFDLMANPPFFRGSPLTSPGWVFISGVTFAAILS
jgi:hypothetical protein